MGMSLRDFFLLCGFSVGIILVGGVILIVLFRRRKNRATTAALSMENQASGSDGQGPNGQTSGHSNGQESVQMGNGYYLGAVPKTRSSEPRVKYHAGAESVSMTLGDYQQDHYKKIAGDYIFRYFPYCWIVNGKFCTFSDEIIEKRRKMELALAKAQVMSSGAFESIPLRPLN